MRGGAHFRTPEPGESETSIRARAWWRPGRLLSIAALVAVSSLLVGLLMAGRDSRRANQCPSGGARSPSRQIVSSGPAPGEPVAAAGGGSEAGGGSPTAGSAGGGSAAGGGS